MARKKSQPNYENVRYQNNAVAEVIARIDFLEPVEKFSKKLVSEVSKKLKPLFPYPENEQIPNVDIVPGDAPLVKTLQWNFWNKSRENRITIYPNAIVASTKAYTTFEDHVNPFIDVINLFCTNNPDVQLNRSGLRYLNQIDIELANSLTNAFDWKNYLAPQLWNVVTFNPDDQARLMRSMNLLEYNFSEYNLRFSFGLPNQDYPAPIKRKTYILDFDAYYQGLQDADEIQSRLEMYHQKIQHLFESSISDGLREKMK